MSKGFVDVHIQQILATLIHHYAMEIAVASSGPFLARIWLRHIVANAN